MLSIEGGALRYDYGMYLHIRYGSVKYTRLSENCVLWLENAISARSLPSLCVARLLKWSTVRISLLPCGLCFVIFMRTSFSVSSFMYRNILFSHRYRAETVVQSNSDHPKYIPEVQGTTTPCV